MARCTVSVGNRTVEAVAAAEEEEVEEVTVDVEKEVQGVSIGLEMKLNLALASSKVLLKILPRSIAICYPKDFTDSFTFSGEKRDL
ncbi:hypothetical protein V6N13_064716 [Hibiscus sabdariffa]|uniref:Uncharacterized protein n=1 Tax=Hibiscus sabdariffa TaxID=183260 RepID=A0ABR2EEH1_9ROSI